MDLLRVLFVLFIMKKSKTKLSLFLLRRKYVRNRIFFYKKNDENNHDLQPNYGPVLHIITSAYHLPG